MTNTPEPFSFPLALTRSPGWEDRFELHPTDDHDPHSGYLHARAGADDWAAVATSIDCTGFRVILDLDEDGNLVGVELLTINPPKPDVTYDPAAMRATNRTGYDLMDIDEALATPEVWVRRERPTRRTDG